MPRQINLPGLSSRNHANQGIAFERELAAVHDFYRMRKLCDVVKNPSEWVFIGPTEYFARLRQHPATTAKTGTTPSGKTYYLKLVASDIDFSGGGRTKSGNFSICFDAKESKSNTFPLTNFQNHQISRLRQSALCGSIAGAMIYMIAVGRVFFVPADFLVEKETSHLKQSGGRAKPGTASISIKEFETHAREIIRDKNGLWDWYGKLFA